MKFFLDNNFSPAYAHVLRAMDVDVIHLREHFVNVSTDDVVWMPEVADRDRVAISQDRSIERRPHEARVRRESGLRMFYFCHAFAKMGQWDQAVFLLRRWSVVESAAPTLKAGEARILQQNGTLRRVG